MINMWVDIKKHVFFLIFISFTPIHPSGEKPYTSLATLLRSNSTPCMSQID